MAGVKDMLGDATAPPTVGARNSSATTPGAQEHKTGLDDLLQARRPRSRSRSRPVSNGPKIGGTTPTAVRGLAKELQELQASSGTLPPLAPVPIVPHFKEKRSLAQQNEAIHWEWMPFINSARPDKAVFFHWEKTTKKAQRVTDRAGGAVPGGEARDDAMDEEEPIAATGDKVVLCAPFEVSYGNSPYTKESIEVPSPLPTPSKYEFARFDRKLDSIVSYTDDEYEQHLKDPSWTKEQTDMLFHLCRQYDLRFIVVADRFATLLTPEKTIEDLRDRYYSITRKLLEVRGKADGMKDSPLFTQPYNKLLAVHEQRRKRQCEQLFRRSAIDVVKEDSLAVEHKRIDAELKKIRMERKKLQQLLASPSPSRALSNSSKKKKKKKSSRSSMDQSDGSRPKKEKTGTYMRSTRIKTPLSVSTRIMQRMDVALDDLGIPRALTPTRAVCEEYEGLRSDLVALMELQGQMKRRHYEVLLLRHQLNCLNTLIPERVPVSNGSFKTTRAPSQSAKMEGDNKRQKTSDTDGNIEAVSSTSSEPAASAVAAANSTDSMDVEGAGMAE